MCCDPRFPGSNPIPNCNYLALGRLLLVGVPSDSSRCCSCTHDGELLQERRPLLPRRRDVLGGLYTVESLSETNVVCCTVQLAY